MRFKILHLILLMVLLNIGNVCKAGIFEVGKGTFLLDKQPFVVKAAELHYPRIPEAYWEHRILACKALGMNTICMYVFWNIHEQEKGKFDFSGNKDIAKFCRLVKKHGMYVIVRPGPYVCAEWEMGGLPWWLLKKKDIQLRSLDPYYLERVSVFMKEVGKQLADLQITRGGNIIMVQVENEFGAYGVDKPYVSAIRDIVRNAGFTDIPLFQCDWNSTFLRNGLDDLMWTINFGTGANIESQFQELKSKRPDSPLMCSEYWSGWFDHWGRQHEKRDATLMVDGIKDMLDNHISFSLYMTHGGTTFGWWGGASNPSYSAMCSSYDYDAPISEAGWTTPKYFKLRNLLQQYQPEQSLPEPPAAFPVIEIPAISKWKVAYLFSNLPKAKEVEMIAPMEEFDQGWGSILYRTVLTEDVKGVLHIDEVHDWAQIFVDGKLLGRLDRRRGENTLPIHRVLKAGTQLDILVEAMGRVNFDQSIHDRKGITSKVEVISADGNKVLKHWKVYNLPPFYHFVKDKKYRKAKSLAGPAYYKATFDLEDVGDTFLDMRTWGKGMVWVNGHALGRFWEIGPQQTLYLPGCWLNKGKNEIIVLDLLGPTQTTVSGIKTPILDMLREQSLMTHKKKGETLNLEGECAVHEGSFTNKNGWQNVTFHSVHKGRYFCIKANSAFHPDSEVSIAELDVLDENGQPITRQDWKIVYADNEDFKDGNHTADKIFDLQESTYWQTEKNVAGPYRVVIDLGKSYNVSGFRLLPRSEKGVPGMIKDFSIFLKEKAFRTALSNQ